MEVDAAASVAELRRTLADHAIERGTRPPSEASLFTDRGERLDDDHLVAVTDLCSGMRVWLSSAPPEPASMVPAVELAVIAGPDLGSPTVLGPGTYSLGGASTDDVVVLGAGLGPAAVMVAVSPDGEVALDSGRGEPARYSAEGIAGGVSVEIGPCTLRVRAIEATDTVDATGGVAFNRTPYRPVAAKVREVEALPAPPTAPPPSKVAITSFVVPLASGVGFAVVFGRPQFLIIALLAPLVLLVVDQVEKRRGKRNFRAEKAAYRRLVDDKVAEVRAAAEEERVDRLRALPTLPRLVEEARTRRPSLWARGRDAPDLLQVRLGTADAAARVRVEVDKGGDDSLRRHAVDRLATATATVGDVPVVLDLDAVAGVAFHGDGDDVDGVVRSVLGQLVARHGPEDVVITALLAPSALRAYEWLRWLPHVRSSASPLPGDQLAVWAEPLADLLGGLLDEAATRRAARRSFPRIVVLVHEDADVDRAALGRLLDVALEVGVRVVWVGRDEALVPRQCTTVVRVSAGDTRSVRASTDADDEPVAFTAEPSDATTLDRLARHLAPLRDVSSVARVGSIPRVVGLTEVLGGTPAPAEVATTWSVSDGGFLGAPVGIGPDGPLELDLVEQGPHALIAGTSGSGKSELLQSWVAALAARHPPERLTFLFIDYKGGAAAAPFTNLAHNVGSVTNLDERLSRRALVSLRAELDRRMALLAEHAGPSDLTELAAFDPAACPPRLVIVVDEFATLIAEIPDFVSGIVDIAQRGRSLGIHLVLATQRPAGAVNEQILANTNLRIALRVVDAADSQNVIGSGEAADIPVPLRGRAFARIGPSELVPFQTAWSGAPRQSGETRRVRVATLGFGRGRDEAAGSPGSSGTQLDDVLRSVSLAFERSGRSRPARPWLPPLPEVVSLELLSVDSGPDRGRVAVLGLVDDPAHQRQGPAEVDLESEGGLAVFGTGGSGRTTALRTAAASLALGSTGDDVQFVGFDFAGRALLPLLELPHTRAVVTADDLEGVAREIEWLAEQVQVRRSILGNERIESLGALRAREGRPVQPRLVVVVDGFGALRAELDKPASYEWLQLLQRVLVEGRQVGIHPVVAADRRADLPNPLLGALGARLVLRMADTDAMVSLGVPLALARAGGLGEGRGYLRGDEEIQVAVLGDDPSGAAQAEALVDLVDASVPVVPRPEPLPDRVLRPFDADHGFAVAIGVVERGDGELEPAMVDLAGGHLLVVGSPGSGRTTALAAVRDGLHALDVPVVTDPAALVDPPVTRPHVLLLDDADDLDPATSRRIEELAGREAVRVVAAFDTASVARAFDGLVPALRRGRRMLVLRPADAGEVDQLAGVRVRLRPGTSFPPGRGVLVVDRHPSVIQVGSG
ncbi:MAG: FtsK/SpoIIIE domain-containing protein [Acidimicrobiales bacterium]|nr:FtsK/SpoIIIE domain-containing protein [Acidimicrobiales bacterium]